MKKAYYEPDFELIMFDFENILTDQNVSDPENSGSGGEEFEGDI